MVFFATKKKLEEFYNSEEFKKCPLRDQANILNELADKSEKNSLVRKATLSGRLTLITKSFGRGTDFKCKDPIVLADDGVHVIQTFLSVELSEEIQIMGRTARQGDYGSYEMILLLNDLEVFLIRPEEVETHKAKSEYRRRHYSVERPRDRDDGPHGGVFSEVSRGEAWQGIC